MPLNRVRIPSPNYSARTAAVRMIVLHTAEGARTYQSLGNFFANPSSKVSSHVGIDDTPGTVGEYVARSGSAWTQANYNSQSVAAELCAFAAWSAAEWQTHPNMLANCAAWIAEESAALGIPIVRLSPAQAQDGRSRGVCQHVDLGSGGGGHTDCGPAFPMDQVISMAKGGAAPGPTPPTPAQPQEDPDMIIIRRPDKMCAWFNGTQKFQIIDPQSLENAQIMGGIKVVDVQWSDFDSVPDAPRVG